MYYNCAIVGPPVVGENFREIAVALRQIGDQLDDDHRLQEWVLSMFTVTVMLSVVYTYLLHSD